MNIFSNCGPKLVDTFVMKIFLFYRKTNTYVAVKVIKNVEKYRFV